MKLVLVGFFQAEAARMRRERPHLPQHWMAAALHPRDWDALEQEIENHRAELFGTAAVYPSGRMTIAGVDIRRIERIVPGWTIFFGPDLSMLSMRELQCHEHDDCRADTDLARVCLAERRRREEEPR